MRPSEQHLKSAYELVAGRLQGHPGQIFGALEMLYRAATTTATSAWVAGRLLHRGDKVTWNHGNGSRSGRAVDFHDGKVGIRFASGSYCAIQNYRVRRIGGSDGSAGK